MVFPIGARIVSTTMEDSRFLEGEGVEDTFTSPFSVGKKLTVYFDNNTYIQIEPGKDRWEDELVICQAGTWDADEDGAIKVIE